MYLHTLEYTKEQNSLWYSQKGRNLKKNYKYFSM